jgi:hypothetical protein
MRKAAQFAVPRTWLRRIVFALSAFVAMAAPASCGHGTGGRLVSIEWSVAGAAEEGHALGESVTDLGWHVRLSEAWLSIGTMRAHRPTELAAGAGWMGLGVPRARAHGGHHHGDEGPRAEWLDPVAVNALDPAPQVLGGDVAEAGAIDRVEVELQGARELGPEALAGALLWVRGEAEREGTVVSFEGTLTLTGAETTLAVDNIAAEETLEEGGRLTVGVRTGRWFDGLQFDLLAPPGDDDPATIEPGTQARNALYLGARSPRAFTVTWTSAEIHGGVE